MNQEQRKLVQTWAEGGPINPVFAIGDSLKNSPKNKTLAIIAPSYLLGNMQYQRLFDAPNVDTMFINKGFMIPGSERSQYYLPLTTKDKSIAWNRMQTYLYWMRRYKGIVLHGMHYNDGTSPKPPYLLAYPTEIQDLIKKCPDTNILPWHHSWGNHLDRVGQIEGMTSFPNFDEWTPRKIPWGHCGAISGFAIPLAMALGYKNIFLVAMGFKFVVKSFYHDPFTKNDAQNQTSDAWLYAADKRFRNQAALAKKHGIKLQIGPSNQIEEELKRYFDTFVSLEDICKAG